MTTAAPTTRHKDLKRRIVALMQPTAIPTPPPPPSEEEEADRVHRACRERMHAAHGTPQHLTGQRAQDALYELGVAAEVHPDDVGVFLYRDDEQRQAYDEVTLAEYGHPTIGEPVAYANGQVLGATDFRPSLALIGIDPTPVDV